MCASRRGVNFLQERTAAKQPHTRTHDTRPPKGGAGGLGARRTQPSSLAVSRLTVNTVKDLNGGASLGFLGQELRPVWQVVASRPRRLFSRGRLGTRGTYVSSRNENLFRVVCDYAGDASPDGIVYRIATVATFEARHAQFWVTSDVVEATKADSHSCEAAFDPRDARGSRDE